MVKTSESAIKTVMLRQAEMAVTLDTESLVDLQGEVVGRRIDALLWSARPHVKNHNDQDGREPMEDLRHCTVSEA